jgi:hypothetical protein
MRTQAGISTSIFCGRVAASERKERDERRGAGGPAYRSFLPPRFKRGPLAIFNLIHSITPLTVDDCILKIKGHDVDIQYTCSPRVHVLMTVVNLKHRRHVHFMETPLRHSPIYPSIPSLMQSTARWTVLSAFSHDRQRMCVQDHI